MVNSLLLAGQRWIRGKLFGGRGHNPICLFTLQQSQIRTIDTLGLVLESKYGNQRGRGEAVVVGGGYILQRSAPRVNLPHGPLHRPQYETMIKKKLLYSQSYQYNSVSVAFWWQESFVTMHFLLCTHAHTHTHHLQRFIFTFRDKYAPGCLTQFKKPCKSCRLEHVICACTDKRK